MKNNKTIYLLTLCIILAGICILCLCCSVVEQKAIIEEMRASHAAALWDRDVALSNADAKIKDTQRMLDDAIKENEELTKTNEGMRILLSTYDAEYVVSNPDVPRYFDVPLDEDLQSFIWTLCYEYGIEDYYGLIFALIQTESNFTSNVISATNDYGLMQINTCNHSWLRSELGITDFLDPYQNARAGVYMISMLLHRYGNEADALMAYNLGEGGAARLWRQGIHSTGYTRTVLAFYENYK